MCRLFRVVGDSLLPEYREGDFVLASKIPFLFRPPLVGDVVVLSHPAYGTLIKRISHVDHTSGVIEVRGTFAGSIDSEMFGPVPVRSLLGKVLLHISQPGKKAVRP
jgi:hypothetical protein